MLHNYEVLKKEILTCRHTKTNSTYVYAPCAMNGVVPLLTRVHESSLGRIHCWEIPSAWTFAYKIDFRPLIETCLPWILLNWNRTFHITFTCNEISNFTWTYQKMPRVCKNWNALKSATQKNKINRKNSKNRNYLQDFWNFIDENQKSNARRFRLTHSTALKFLKTLYHVWELGMLQQN